MRGAAGGQERGKREQHPGQPRRHHTPAQVAGEEEHRVGVQDAEDQVEDVEGGDEAEPRLQREGQQVREDRVVVQREVGAAGGGEEGRRIEGAAPRQQLVPEVPEVPDVDTGVAGGVTGEVGRKM